MNKTGSVREERFSRNCQSSEVSQVGSPGVRNFRTLEVRMFASSAVSNFRIGDAL
jgi:hypothetical protein